MAYMIVLSGNEHMKGYHMMPQCTVLQTWESKAKHASNDRETALKQVSELQERLDAQGSSAQQSSQAIRAIEQRTAALQRQMSVKVCCCSLACHLNLTWSSTHFMTLALCRC